MEPMSMPAHPPERCQACGSAMKAVRSVPRVGPFPELVTFKCEHCGHLDTKSIEDNGLSG
jgi:hypothetical protein